MSDPTTVPEMVRHLHEQASDPRHLRLAGVVSLGREIGSRLWLERLGSAVTIAAALTIAEQWSPGLRRELHRRLRWAGHWDEHPLAALCLALLCLAYGAYLLDWRGPRA